MNGRTIFLAGSILGGLGVVLGAFGAHWLEGAIRQWGLAPEEQVKRLATWEVAVRYQMYHALALLAVGLFAMRSDAKRFDWPARLFFVGVVIFSGCLYALVLSGVKPLGAIVPIGGVCLVAGWALFARAAWTLPNRHH